MAYSPELGMRVFDPREGAQIGLAAGRAFADAYQSAQDRELRERQLAGIEAENRRKAALLNLQQMGLAELRDEVARGTPFEEALFKAGPKLFADKPEAIVSAIENRAKAEATKTYRESVLKLREDAAKSLEAYRSQSPLLRESMDMARLEQEAGPILKPRTAEPEADESWPREPEPILSPDVALKRRALEHMQERRGASESAVESQIAQQVADEEKLAVASGKPAWTDQQRLQRRVELRTLKSFKPGLSAHLSYDEQGRPILDLGEGKPTVGTQTAIQRGLADLKNSVVQIDRAKTVLTEKDVGVAGAIWDGLVNKWVAQVVPGAADPSVSANRAQIQKTVDSFLESQQSRGRLSAAERADMRAALVTRKAGESLPRAKEVLDTMSRIQKFDAIAMAKSGQQSLQDWMFRDLTQTEIKQLVREGILTEDEGIDWALKALER